MRNLLTGLALAGCLIGGTAFAANNDVVELGLGVRLLFDADTYSGDNPEVDYMTDVFPIAGDHAMGFGINGALGHRFDSRLGPYEVLLKYNFSRGSEDGNGNGVQLSSPSGPFYRIIVGQLDQHDLILAFRLPGRFMPVPVLNWEKLYYDLGVGVTTLSYDYSGYDMIVAVPPIIDVGDDTRRTRSGLAYNLGIGFRQELSEDLLLSLRADFIMGKIQDIENSDGVVTRVSPNAHGARLQIGLVHYFEAMF